MANSLFFIELVNVLIFALLSFILIQQYRLTKVPECLIMAFAFLAKISLYSIDILFNMIYFQPHSGSISIPFYLALQKFLLLLHILFWAPFFIIGYRTQWDRGHKVHLLLFVLSSLILLALTLNLEFEEIPNKSIIFGIPIASNFSTGFGGIMEVQPQFYYGQGHPFLFVIYRLYCATIFIYAYVNLENPLQYPRFNQVRLAWVSVFSIYCLSQIIFLISLFSFRPLSPTAERFAVLFAVLGLVFLGFFAPEGIVLPKAQIMNLRKVYKILGYNDEVKGQKLLMKKTMDYMNYVAVSMADHTDKLD